MTKAIICLYSVLFTECAAGGNLLTCGRNPGTFREPVYILKEKPGFSDWTDAPIDEKQAVKCIVEKLTASLGVTDPVYVSHLSEYRTSDIIPVYEELKSENKVLRLPYKIERKNYYIHSSKTHLLNAEGAGDSGEIRLISPMDTIVRDKTRLKHFLIIHSLLSISRKKE